LECRKGAPSGRGRLVAFNRDPPDRTTCEENDMLKIYGVPISVHTRKVIVTAIAKKLRYENEPVIPFNPPPGWDELSPTGKIPVVADGDLVLRDSSVICTYLERVYPEHPLYPAETRDLMQALWLEEYADGTIFREVIHGLFFQKVVRPNILKQETDGAAVAKILNDAVPRVFGYLERTIDGAHLVAGRFGIADIATVSNLINFHYLGYRIDARRFPKLAAYFGGSLRQPAIETALRAEQPVAASLGLDQSLLREAIAA
jgi:glutathione S-transferase